MNSRARTTTHGLMNWARRVVAAAGFVLAALVPAFSAAGVITYYHNDLLGSPMVATDASGQVVWRESYRPYGERLVNDPATVGERIWFTSRSQDPDTGLIYLGARYYDPAAGRFLSTDPKTFDEANVHSFNRYAYGNDNPYKYVDPDGRFAILLWALGGYGAGVAADALSQYAAWGSWDLKMAMSSSAAQSGGLAGLMGPAEGGGVGLTIERVGGQAISEGIASNAASGIWRSSRIDAAKAEHIFSADHVKNGIMDLGASPTEILSQARNALMTADRSGALREGPNTVITRMNGQDATIRTFMRNGEMQSLDVFKGISNRQVQNVIDVR